MRDCFIDRNYESSCNVGKHIGGQLGSYCVRLSKKEIKHTTAEGGWVVVHFLFWIMKISRLGID